MIEFVRRLSKTQSGREALVLMVTMLLIAAAEFYFLLRSEDVKTSIVALMGIGVAWYVLRVVFPRWDAEERERVEKEKEG